MIAKLNQYKNYADHYPTKLRCYGFFLLPVSLCSENTHFFTAINAQVLTLHYKLNLFHRVIGTINLEIWPTYAL